MTFRIHLDWLGRQFLKPLVLLCTNGANHAVSIRWRCYSL